MEQKGSINISKRASIGLVSIVEPPPITDSSDSPIEYSNVAKKADVAAVLKLKQDVKHELTNQQQTAPKTRSKTDPIAKKNLRTGNIATPTAETTAKTGIATAAALKARAKLSGVRFNNAEGDNVDGGGNDAVGATDADNPNQISAPGAYPIGTTFQRESNNDNDINDGTDGHPMQDDSLVLTHQSAVSSLSGPTPLEAELVDPAITAVPLGDDEGEENTQTLSKDVSELRQEISQNSRSNRRLLVILISVLAVAIVIAIVVAVIWTQVINRGGDNNDNTASMALMVSEQDIIENIQEKTMNTTIFSFGSPSQQALTWVTRDFITQSLAREGMLERVVQRYTLALLYFSTNGFNWNQNLNWITASDECLNWVGVVCSGDVVTTLALQSNALEGNIPPQVLLLFENSLVNLNVARNRLDGTIPTVLTRLLQLTDLRLFENRLTGTIPNDLGRLTDLRHFAVTLNQLTGTLPSIPRLTALTFLGVRDNPLTGTIPSSFASLDALEELYIFNTNLMGSVPSELCDTIRLGWIDCADVMCDCCTGRMEEPCPSQSDMFTSLRSVIRFVSPDSTIGNNATPAGQAMAWIDSDAVSARLFRSIGNAGNNVIPDPMISIVQRFALATLYFSANGPQRWSDRGWVDPNESECVGWNVQDLQCDSQLRISSIQLTRARLRGRIPMELGLLSNGLTRLDLARNGLFGSIPSRLSRLTLLQDLRLFENDLVGSIPADIGALTELKHLALTLNSLTGKIPQGIGSLSQLTFLDLRDNGFTGTLPNLENLSTLFFLYLFNLNVGGTLPSSLCPHLQDAWIDCGEIACTCCTERDGMIECPTP